MIMALIRRFETTIFRDTTVGTKTQIPAEGALVVIYKQGATVSAATTVPADTETSIPVYATGSFEVGDFVESGGISLGHVHEIPDETHVTVSGGGSSVALLAGDRLINITGTSATYLTPTGVDDPISSAVTNAAGLVWFYCAEPTFDLVITGTGLTRTEMIDNPGGTDVSALTQDPLSTSPFDGNFTGIQLPVLTALTDVEATDHEGMVVYDGDTQSMYFSDGTDWHLITVSA
jgi:hypothetical protein